MVLGITVNDDVTMSFSDGVILCQLVNRLFPNTIPSIMEGEVRNPILLYVNDKVLASAYEYSEADKKYWFVPLGL